MANSEQSTDREPFIPDAVEHDVGLKLSVKRALRGADHNPDGHVLFRIYDAVYVEASVPHNMGKSTRWIGDASHELGEPTVVCSCGEEFEDRSAGHSHLMDVQGETSA